MCEKKNGYLTVEASLIMPFVFVGIVFVMFTGFYLYDTAVVKQLCYVSALRGSQQKGLSSDEIEKYTKTELDDLLQNRLVAVKSLESRAEVSVTKVKIEAEIKLQMPFTGFLSEKLELWTFETKEEASRVNPVTVIRGIRNTKEFIK